MRDAGILTIYRLIDASEPGLAPKEDLRQICTAYYAERTVGVTRAYAAMSANQQIDKLVRCFNTVLPIEAEYAVLEDGNQYRISLKQQEGDHIDLTLVRLEDFYDIASE